MGYVSHAVDLLHSKADPRYEGKSAGQRLISELDIGMHSIFVVADYVDRGAPHALSVENSFNLNYDIEFDGEGLIQFLRECFSEFLAKERGESVVRGIEPDGRYVVRTFDMS